MSEMSWKADARSSGKLREQTREADKYGNEVRCRQQKCPRGFRCHIVANQCPIQRKLEQPHAHGDRLYCPLKLTKEHAEREQHACRDVGAVPGTT